MTPKGEVQTEREPDVGRIVRQLRNVRENWGDGTLPARRHPSAAAFREVTELCERAANALDSLLLSSPRQPPGPSWDDVDSLCQSYDALLATYRKHLTETYDKCAALHAKLRVNGAEQRLTVAAMESSAAEEPET